MSTYRFKRQVVLNPGELGLDGVLIANGAEVTGSNMDLTGVDELAVYLNVDYAAGTNLRVALDVTPEAGSVSNWFLAQSESVTVGVGTANDYVTDRAIAADKKYVLKFKNINALQGRLRLLSTGGTTDTVVVRAIKAF